MTRGQEDLTAGVVITVIIILVASVLVSVNNSTTQSQDKQCTATLAVAHSPADSLALLAAQPLCVRVIHK